MSIMDIFRINKIKAELERIEKERDSLKIALADTDKVEYRQLKEAIENLSMQKEKLDQALQAVDTEFAKRKQNFDQQLMELGKKIELRRKEIIDLDDKILRRTMAGITIQFIDGGKIRVTISNQRFSGESIVDEDGIDRKLIAIGNRLKGFPKQVNDVEEIGLGTNVAYLGLKFYCLDEFGHLAVYVTLEDVASCWYERPESGDKVCFEIGLEPAQIDQFVEEVIELGKTKQGTATLKCIPL